MVGMKKFAVVVIGAVAATLVVALVVRAAGVTVPARIGYNGTLLAGTTPASDGNYILTFSLFPVGTAGTALWTETQTSVPVSGGRFSVELGSVTAIPATVWAAADLWLEIKVGAETLAPRQHVTSVPYAIQATPPVPPVLTCRTVSATSSTDPTVATATCASGELVTGGACQSTPSMGAWYGSTLESSFPDDQSFRCTSKTMVVNCGGTSCSFYGPATTTAQARCCKMQP